MDEGGGVGLNDSNALVVIKEDNRGMLHVPMKS